MNKYLSFAAIGLVSAMAVSCQGDKDKKGAEKEDALPVVKVLSLIHISEPTRP